MAANDNRAGEIWRPIPSLPEYIASSEGRIMRVPYVGPMPRGGERAYGGEPYFGIWSEEDLRFILQYRGKTYKVARLICEAFHGPAPVGKPMCMHLDEDSRHNRPSNLAWGSQKENLNAPGYLSAKQGFGPQRKISPADAALIRSRAANGEAKAALAREYGVAPCTISNMTRRAA